MSAVLREPAPVMAPHWKLSTGEYHQMIAAGILREDDRVELIEGELIDMAPIGSLHASLSSQIALELGHATRGRAIPWSQNPISLGPRSEPQPDFALLRPRADRYRSGLPRAEDVLWVIEIADSSLRYDREVKGALYALAGLPEYWIVNLAERAIEVHRQPDPAAGRYLAVSAGGAEPLSPLAFPDLRVDVAAWLD